MVTDLDRSSWEPLYSQISQRIRVKVEHDLNPGDKIPSENALISEYNVSRNTVRQAVDLLIKQGLVYRVRGKGTFVAPERLKYGLFRLVSFTEEIRRLGMHPTSKLLNQERIVPLPKIARALQLELDQEVFLIERLRSANGKPMALNASYVPCHLCPALDKEDLSTGSIYQVIESKYRLSIGYASQILKPTLASEYEAGLLRITPGSPLLHVEGTAYLVDGRPIEYARLLYRGDLYEFPIQAIRRTASETPMELNGIVNQY